MGSSIPEKQTYQKEHIITDVKEEETGKHCNVMSKLRLLQKEETNGHFKAYKNRRKQADIARNEEKITLPQTQKIIQEIPEPENRRCPFSFFQAWRICNVTEARV